MADLSRRVASTETRGQILLVTALVLGVSFVALALILNSAIFTENLASRGDTTGADEVVTYHNNLQDGVGKIVAVENRNATDGDSHTTVRDRIEMGMTNASGVAVRRHAKRGAISNVSIVDHDDGARVFQTNSSRDLTDGNGQPDWTVVDNVPATRAFRLNVTDRLESDPFVVTVTDDRDSWELYVRESRSNDAEITVDNGTDGEVSCGTETMPVKVDLTAGTVADDRCDALSFADAPIDGTHNVTFDNGSAITGTYSLVVDDESEWTSSSPHFGANDDPSVTPAAYDLTLRYQYETSDLRVATDLRVAPGEPDGR